MGKRSTEEDVGQIVLVVNGEQQALRVGGRPDEVKVTHTLAHTLRETLDFTGTKTPCNNGECGGCTVLMDGEPVLACSILTVECNGRHITTVEGLSNRETGELHPLQRAFVEYDAIQCGMCTPGILMSLKSLFDKNHPPSETEVREAISGNLCRCTGYVKYVEAALAAAEEIRKEKGWDKS